MSYLCSLWLFPRCPTHCSVFVFLFCLSSSSVTHIYVKTHNRTTTKKLKIIIVVLNNAN
jgi:hypothetical protein